ncbi:hypothetical protein DERF_006021 [Dermatophagoides farinae]
MSDVC